MEKDRQKERQQVLQVFGVVTKLIASVSTKSPKMKLDQSPENYKQAIKQFKSLIPKNRFTSRHSKSKSTVSYRLMKNQERSKENRPVSDISELESAIPNEGPSYDEVEALKKINELKETCFTNTNRSSRDGSMRRQQDFIVQNFQSFVSKPEFDTQLLQ